MKLKVKGDRKESNLDYCTDKYRLPDQNHIIIECVLLCWYDGVDITHSGEDG